MALVMSAMLARRSLTIRIEDVPLDHIGALEDNLREIAAPHPDLREIISTLRRRSLVRRQRDANATVTVTVETPIPGEELCSQLQQAGTAYPYQFSCRFLGITPLYEDEHGASVDVIAVPGLGSHALGSWKSPNRDVVWLRDYLPGDLSSIRVLLYGYDTTLQHSTSRQSIEHLGRTLLEDLVAFRAHEGTNRRPIIFIGHSLGGLLIKEALVHAGRGASNTGKLDLRESCYGMLFFGVPHLGLQNEHLMTIVRGQPNENLIHDLVVDRHSEPSTLSKRISDDFSRVCKGRYQVVSFFELRLSRIVEKQSDGMLRNTGPLSLLVTEKSATSTGVVAVADEDNIPLDTDHSGLVKFESKHHGPYPIVRERLKRMVHEAENEVPRRFEKDHRANEGPQVHNNLGKRFRSDAFPIISGRGPKRICAGPTDTGDSDSADLYEVSHRQTAAEKALTLSQDQRDRLLQSLRFDQDDARRDTVKLAATGTCRWLLDEKAYQDWLDSDQLVEHHGFLWIKGKPGAGKSTLMKFALSEAPKRHKGSTIISFFFNARGNDLEKSTVGMYRWLLWEIFTSIPALQKVFDSPGRKSWNHYEDDRWPLERLKELFMDSIQNLGSLPLVCFIDALDECDDSEIGDMLSFFEDVCEEAMERGLHFRVYFSSRHYPNLSVKHHIPLVLEDQTGHSQDITAYIRKKLKIGNSKAAVDVKDRIQAKANGIFLWVVLVVGILNKEYAKGRIQALRQRLEEIPPDLHSLFRNILTRDGQDRSELILCIQWVLFAKQPLTPEQLYFAIQSGLEPDQLSSWDPEKISRDDIQRSLLYSSKGLAEVTRSKAPTIQFIHESVRDYLLKDNGLSEIWQDLNDNFVARSHDRLKHCCASYMKIDTSDALKFGKALPSASSKEGVGVRNLVGEKFPLMEYAIRHILYHADLAQYGSIAQQAFINDFPLERWITLSNVLEKFQTRRYTQKASLLYILAEKNLSHLIAIHPSILSYLDVGDERYGPPLFASLAMGSYEAIEAFIRAEMEKQHHNNVFHEMCNLYLNGQNRSKFGRDFSFSKQKQLSSYLATRGDELACALFYSSRVKGSPVDFQTLLSQAASTGREAVVKLLLEQEEATVNVLDEKDRTPLSRAAKRGHDAIVRLLLTGNADVDLQDKEGRTSLSLAAEQGHDTIVRLLLEIGKASVDTPDKNGRTPLSWAAENGHDAIMRLLLQKSKANINLRDQDGRTPLWWAVLGGSDTTIGMLLETGNSDIDKPDKNGRTPLSVAAAGSKHSIVRMLLETSKADMDAPDKDGRTPVSWATLRGSDAIFSMLIETGKFDVDKPDKDGRTPLSLAAERGRHTIVRLLLETGKVEIDKQDKHGRTPLSWAAANRQGREDVVMLLLEKRAGVDTSDNNDRTPLSWAVGYRPGDVGGRGLHIIVLLLLELGKAVADKQDGDGRTPLSRAAEQGDSTNVDLLLKLGKVDMNKQDRNGQTPLLWAAKRGHGNIARLLLQTGKVSVDAQDKHGRTPLSWAAERGHDTVARLLLETGKASVNTQDKNGQTPLFWAVRWRNEIIVRLFLETGKVDMDQQDKSGRTPLSWAAGEGTETVVKLVLNESKAILDLQDNHGRTPLSWAAARKMDNAGIIGLLLKESNASIDTQDKRGRTPLSLASQYGHVPAMTLLLKESQASVNTPDKAGRTPLSWAVSIAWYASWVVRAVRLLLETGKVNVDLQDEEGRTPLSRAAEMGHDPIVRLLLKESKASVDTQDKDGRTPLSWAAATLRHGDAVVELLLKKGKASVNTPDKDGRTPLSWAAEVGNHSVVGLLLATGKAGIDTPDKDGRTPLSWATADKQHFSRERASETVRLLLETGKIDVNKEDKEGRTPLSQAAEGGHDTIVRLLLGTGKASVKTLDKNGRTPLSWAIERGHSSVVGLLLETDKADMVT